MLWRGMDVDQGDEDEVEQAHETTCIWWHGGSECDCAPGKRPVDVLRGRAASGADKPEAAPRPRYREHDASARLYGTEKGES